MPGAGPVRLFVAACIAWVMCPSIADAGTTWCHRVTDGETLHGVARRHRTTVAVLKTLNGIRNPARLRTGTLLVLRPADGIYAMTRRLRVPPLTARAGNLRREAEMARRERLSRIRNGAMLRRFVQAGLLVPIPAATATYRVDGVMPEHRLARPWTRRFITDVATGYHGLAGRPLRITGLTRTAEFQRRLRLSNVNAAPAAMSTHVTGAAVDIGTRDVPPHALAWLRHVLRRLTDRGVVVAIEETRYPHFHILVRRAYLDYSATVAEPRLVGIC